MAGKWKYAKKGRKAMKGKRNRFGKKKSRFADVHSFKLTGNETTWFSSPDGTGLAVQTRGPNVGLGNISTGGSGPTQTSRFGGVALMTISNVTQWSQLNTLFDRYKIYGVKYTFIPEFNVAQTVQSGILPVIKFVHDYDDNATPTVGDVWSRQGKEYRFTKPISVYVKPKILGATIMGNGSGTTAFGLCHKAPYINMGFGNIPHLGLKFAVKDWPTPVTGATAQVVCRVETTYYVSFREQINIGALGHTGLEDSAPAGDVGAIEDTACELKPPPM